MTSWPYVLGLVLVALNLGGILCFWGWYWNSMTWVFVGAGGAAFIGFVVGLMVGRKGGGHA